MTYTAQIVDEAQTPTGEMGMLIECTCSTHKGNTRAIVRGNAIPVSHIHGMVLAAWHPFALAGAASIKRLGPWAVCGDCDMPLTQHCAECAECPRTAGPCWCGAMTYAGV